MPKPKIIKELTEAVGRLFNDILNPENPISPIKTRTDALKIAKEFKFSEKKTGEFVKLSLKARRDVANELNKGYGSFINRDTTLVVNLRESTNQQIKKAVVQYLKDTKSITIKQLEKVFESALEGAVIKQRDDLDKIARNEVETLINRLSRNSDDVANIINEYSPFGKKGTQNLADMVKNENWSTLGMVLVSLESVIQAFNRMGIKIDPRMKRRLYARFFNVSAATGRSLIQRKNGKVITHQSKSEFSKLYNEIKHGLNDKNLVRTKVMSRTLDFVIDELEKNKVLRTETNKAHLEKGTKVYQLFEKAMKYEPDKD